MLCIIQVTILVNIKIIPLGYLVQIFVSLTVEDQVSLKAVDTIGNCQRLAFTVGVSQHMHKITNL